MNLLGGEFINKLSFGLLSLLTTEPMSGYDLTQKLNRFWRSTHSAIYPMLNELLVKGHIEFISETQLGKPDKKIYNLTPQGKSLLHDWFMSETSDAVTRDEMILKLYCITCVDEKAADKILNELEERYRGKVLKYTTHLENIRHRTKEDIKDASSLFGAYILTQRALSEAILHVQWCEWIRNLYDNRNASFLDSSYLDTTFIIESFQT